MLMKARDHRPLRDGRKSLTVMGAGHGHRLEKRDDMKIRSELLFPSELTPGVQIRDPRDQEGAWAPVVAVCSGDQEVQVWVDRQADALVLPAAERVWAQHIVADHLIEHEDDEESAELDELMTSWYYGDLDSAHVAVAGLQDNRGAATRAGTHNSEAKLGRTLKHHYSGDLTTVLHHHRQR